LKHPQAARSTRMFKIHAVGSSTCFMKPTWCNFGAHAVEVGVRCRQLTSGVPVLPTLEPAAQQLLMLFAPATTSHVLTVVHLLLHLAVEHTHLCNWWPLKPILFLEKILGQPRMRRHLPVHGHACQSQFQPRAQVLCLQGNDVQHQTLGLNGRGAGWWQMRVQRH